MGCDIHAVFQAKGVDSWHDVPSNYKGNRHYFLFAWLAGVRNGYGFARVPTHSPLTPISEPRGLPADFDGVNHKTTKEVFAWRSKYHKYEDNPTIWLGDHSHSWLTAGEILKAERPDRLWTTGVVEREWFDIWDGVTPPELWSSGISGRDVRVAESPIAVVKDTTHVRIYWRRSAGELNEFIDEVNRLRTKYGEVRMVFGFDS